MKSLTLKTKQKKIGATFLFQESLEDTPFSSLHSKQDHPGSPLFCHDHSKIINENKMKVKSKEIYNGLVGIAFETQEKDNLEFVQFVNVQGHRVWIESIVNGKIK